MAGGSTRFSILYILLAPLIPLLGASAAPQDAQGAISSQAGPPPQVKNSSRANDEREIRDVLAAQAKAWNRGSIADFMNGYARSPNTTFVSGDEVTRGWETVRARYARKYDDRTKMGNLQFSEIEISQLSTDAAVIIGRWRLQRAQDTPHGRFTLIFRRFPEGWRIVQDHTSSAAP